VLWIIHTSYGRDFNIPASTSDVNERKQIINSLLLLGRMLAGLLNHESQAGPLDILNENLSVHGGGNAFSETVVAV
jgi:hypothetical protein